MDPSHKQIKIKTPFFVYWIVSLLLGILSYRIRMTCGFDDGGSDFLQW